MAKSGSESRKRDEVSHEGHLTTSGKYNPKFIAGSYFTVMLVGVGGAIVGDFTKVSGLGMEVEYTQYREGGSNYTRMLIDGVKPQTLVLEQGVVTGADSGSILMNTINLGMSCGLSGVVILNDSFGIPQRTWTITDAYLTKYEGPTLDANQVQAAVTTMELIYNGAC